MKTMIAFITLFFMMGFSSMAGTETTVQNLKDAYKGESTASAKYAAFAEQARKEGFPQMGYMFDATSKAEAIHAANHKLALEKMGGKTDPVKPEFIVKTTKENLEDAIKGESFEINSMYPGYISSARSDNALGATKSFTWAMDTEKKHLQMYTNALNALNAKKANTLPTVYMVCPKCGNTYDKKPEKACSFCSTASTKFLKFGK